MNLRHPILLTLFCMFLLAPLSAHSEALSDEKIRSFISSLKALQGLEQQYDDLPDDLPTDEEDIGMEDLSSIFSTSVEQMKGHDMYNDLKEVVQEHGFSSPEQWGETGDRIFRAWSALEMGQQSGQVNQEMAKAMKEMENNPDMSEAQKQQVRDMMGGAVSAMDHAASAPEADKQAVRPHIEALRSATTEDDGEY